MLAAIKHQKYIDVHPKKQKHSSMFCKSNLENDLLNTPTCLVILTCNNCFQLDRNILNSSCMLAS